jgi:hypothetical protein
MTKNIRRTISKLTRIMKQLNVEGKNWKNNK